MLHLLDPQVYPLDCLDSFKQRVQLRQESRRRSMMDLREDESNFFLGDTLNVLGELLAETANFKRYERTWATSRTRPLMNRTVVASN